MSPTLRSTDLAKLKNGSRASWERGVTLRDGRTSSLYVEGYQVVTPTEPDGAPRMAPVQRIITKSRANAKSRGYSTFTWVVILPVEEAFEKAPPDTTHRPGASHHLAGKTCQVANANVPP
eukprot:scaffold63537_cov31-Prasinocladus_malaysianus.AAC.1